MLVDLFSLNHSVELVPRRRFEENEEDRPSHYEDCRGSENLERANQNKLEYDGIREDAMIRDLHGFAKKARRGTLRHRKNFVENRIIIKSNLDEYEKVGLAIRNETRSLFATLKRHVTETSYPSDE